MLPPRVLGATWIAWHLQKTVKSVLVPFLGLRDAARDKCWHASRLPVNPAAICPQPLLAPSLNLSPSYSTRATQNAGNSLFSLGTLPSTSSRSEERDLGLVVAMLTRDSPRAWSWSRSKSPAYAGEHCPDFAAKITPSIGRFACTENSFYSALVEKGLVLDYAASGETCGVAQAPRL